MRQIRRAGAKSLTAWAQTAGIEALKLLPKLGDFNEDLRDLGVDDLRAVLRVQLALDDVPRLIAMIAAVAVVTFTMGAKPVPRFVWNASESVPIGLYSVQPADRLMVTSLVVAIPPEPIATFVPPAPAGAPTGTIQMNDVFIDEREIVYCVDRHVGGLYCLEMDF